MSSAPEVHIRLTSCCLCDSSDNLLQHHEPPKNEGGYVDITLCKECSDKRHSSEEKEEVAAKIRKEIKKRVGFV